VESLTYLRHTGPMEFYFFLIINPGFEELALEEMLSKCAPLEQKVIKGGIEVKADLDWMINAHTRLKIPTRILLRLESFKVKDFPKLHQKFSRINWNSYLSHPNPKFEITASKSRLFHTDRIQETCESALAEAFVRQPLKKDWEKFDYPPQTLFLRFADDLLTISLDLTGDPLYKRGMQTIKGDAPLRETIASALLVELFQKQTTPVTLIDPMCGSGTFLFEAKSYHEPLHLRKFAFEYAPFFKGKLIKKDSIPSSPFPVQEFVGFDINEELISRYKDTTSIHFSYLDSLKNPLPLKEKPIFMICNPPYGERLKIKGSRGLFLKEALDKFLKEDAPDRMGWLVPSDFDDLFQSIKNYRLLSKRKFRNGGMAVTFWVWEK